MKIVWVVRPAEGGILRHLQQLLTGISDLEIVVVGPSNLQDWAGSRRFIPLDDLVDGLRMRRDVAAIKRLRGILRQERAQIVHAHGLKAALITAGALVPKGKTQFLFTAHNSLPQGNSPSGRWGVRLTKRWLFHGIDTIISVSDAVRSQIIRYAPERKVLTIHNGIAPANFGIFGKTEARELLGLATDDLVVGTVARLIPDKGINTLLEASSLVAKIISNLRLVIVGDGPERFKLERYAEALDLKDRVLFLGWRDDVPELMSSWDCFVMPSLAEGFNLSVLEAMASRLPVVISDLPALKEAVVPGQGGLAVRAGNAPELAAALLHLLKFPEKSKLMGEFNRERVNTLFGEERMIKSTRALYEGLRP